MALNGLHLLIHSHPTTPSKIRYSTEIYMELYISASSTCHFRFLGRLRSDFNEINIAIFTIRYPFKIEIIMKIA